MRVDEGNRTDEIARLSMTFNRMLDRLESAFNMQQSFVANASHELRTPLTSVTGQIEVALMKSRDREEYVAVLQSVLEDIRNLNTLSNGLLDLAKASFDMAAVTLQPVRIDEIIWETRAELTVREPGYTVDIHFDEPIEEENELTLNGNVQLLKSAVHNLMDNGCKFSSGHKVEVHLHSSGEQIILQFIDQGIGIPREDIEKSFTQPFYRADNVHGIHGSGLGLPLAFQIIRLHGGMLAIDSLPGKGTTVTVTLPVMS
jgi:signal transduction histidine kinase